MQDDLGVDRPGARRHRHALERAEAHRRVDRAPVAHGRHRAAAAEVADHEPPDAHLLGRPLHREPVEPVAADAPLVAPARRERVRRRLLGHRAVERRVEDGDVRHVREHLHRLVDRVERLPRRGAARGRPPRRARPVTAPSTTTGSPKRAPPWTTRCATASTCASANESTGRERSSPSTIESLRLVEPALTTRTELTPSSARSSRGSRGRPRRAHACRRARAAVRLPSPAGCAPPARRATGTRSITSITRWKRSRSFSITMSNGVVVVPSSL